MITKSVKIYSLIILSIIISLIQGCAFTHHKPPKTVAHIDKPRFLGRWYEISSVPSFFQAGCECTTGDYTEEATLLTNAPVIKIHNKCYDSNQKHFKSAHGKVFITKGTGNAKLKIEFLWPFSEDYWILYAEPKNPEDKTLPYQTTIIGTPDYKYLWILARTPTVPLEKQKQLFNIAKSRGYNINKLKLTSQHCFNKAPQKALAPVNNQDH
jgi:apolipoprotein D and lipocalin family protein